MLREGRARCFVALLLASLVLGQDAINIVRTVQDTTETRGRVDKLLGIKVSSESSLFSALSKVLQGLQHNQAVASIDPALLAHMGSLLTETAPRLVMKRLGIPNEKLELLQKASLKLRAGLQARLGGCDDDSCVPSAQELSGSLLQVGSTGQIITGCAVLVVAVILLIVAIIMFKWRAADPMYWGSVFQYLALVALVMMGFAIALGVSLITGTFSSDFTYISVMTALLLVVCVEVYMLWRSNEHRMSKAFDKEMAAETVKLERILGWLCVVKGIALVISFSIGQPLTSGLEKRKNAAASVLGVFTANIAIGIFWLYDRWSYKESRHNEELSGAQLGKEAQRWNIGEERSHVAVASMRQHKGYQFAMFLFIFMAVVFVFLLIATLAFNDEKKFDAEFLPWVGGMMVWTVLIIVQLYKLASNYLDYSARDIRLPSSLKSGKAIMALPAWQACHDLCPNVDSAKLDKCLEQLATKCRVKSVLSRSTAHEVYCERRLPRVADGSCSVPPGTVYDKRKDVAVTPYGSVPLADKMCILDHTDVRVDNGVVPAMSVISNQCPDLPVVGNSDVLEDGAELAKNSQEDLSSGDERGQGPIVPKDVSEVREDVSKVREHVSKVHEDVSKVNGGVGEVSRSVGEGSEGGSVVNKQVLVSDPTKIECKFSDSDADPSVQQYLKKLCTDFKMDVQETDKDAKKSQLDMLQDIRALEKEQSTRALELVGQFCHDKDAWNAAVANAALDCHVQEERKSSTTTDFWVALFKAVGVVGLFLVSVDVPPTLYAAKRTTDLPPEWTRYIALGILLVLFVVDAIRGIRRAEGLLQGKSGHHGTVGEGSMATVLLELSSPLSILAMAMPIFVNDLPVGSDSPWLMRQRFAESDSWKYVYIALFAITGLLPSAVAFFTNLGRYGATMAMAGSEASIADVKHLVDQLRKLSGTIQEDGEPKTPKSPGPKSPSFDDSVSSKGGDLQTPKLDGSVSSKGDNPQTPKLDSSVSSTGGDLQPLEDLDVTTEAKLGFWTEEERSAAKTSVERLLLGEMKLEVDDSDIELAHGFKFGRGPMVAGSKAHRKIHVATVVEDYKEHCYFKGTNIQNLLERNFCKHTEMTTGSLFNTFLTLLFVTPANPEANDDKLKLHLLLSDEEAERFVGKVFPLYRELPMEAKVMEDQFALLLERLLTWEEYSTGNSDDVYVAIRGATSDLNNGNADFVPTVFDRFCDFEFTTTANWLEHCQEVLAWQAPSLSVHPLSNVGFADYVFFLLTGVSVNFCTPYKLHEKAIRANHSPAAWAKASSARHTGELLQMIVPAAMVLHHAFYGAPDPKPLDQATAATTPATTP